MCPGRTPCGPLPNTVHCGLDGGHTKTMTATLQAWPFPCLRLGSLRDQSITGDLLEVVLDGLELVPTNTACPSNRKDRVLAEAQ